MLEEMRNGCQLNIREHFAKPDQFLAEEEEEEEVRGWG
jgi:hypothetical protein